MIRLEHQESYNGASHMAKVISRTRPSYDLLIDTLGQFGTEIRRDRTLEIDCDVRPNRFVREGTMEFIFPPQEVTLLADQSSSCDVGTGYDLTFERITYQYNPELVRGHLRVEYADAGQNARLSVTDIIENSELPEEVQSALTKTFNPTNPPQS